MDSMPVPHISPTDLITAITIIIGFGITVFMFRVGREAATPKNERWVALSDYLIFASIGLAVTGLVLLFFAPSIKSWRAAVATAASVGAVILQAGFIPAILAHYRIAFGRDRQGPRESAEPFERLCVIITSVIAITAFVLVLYQHLSF